jgi:3-hydroxyacyl-CoA dehydrogenase
MSRQIRKVAVLGAGVMGAGIAAHLANAGIPSLLFDLERPHKALQALLKHKPKPLMHPDFLAMIEPCSFGEDAARLSEVDWVVEAVTERLDIKRKVFQTVRDNAGPDTIITSNTSGIPIASITADTPESFRKRFFVTHFFNPPRYMKLLELVDGPETDPELFADFAAWGERRLGKGIVVGKDTPNFVANRIGTYGMMALLHKVVEQGFTVPQVDKIFGKAMGRPSSAIFRTADVVGLDTLAHVAKNCFDTLTSDPHRDVFQLPAFLQALLDRGDLGSKTGAGFYKKAKGADGSKVILSLNLQTLAYEEQEKVRFESLGKVREIEDPGKRVKTLLACDDAAAKIAWEATADTLLYSAALLGEICDDVVAIDNAMKWGYAWDQGPFETWDAIGLSESVERMRGEGRDIPAVVDQAVKAGGWYHREAGVTRFVDVVGNGELKTVPKPKGAIFLSDVRDAGGVVKKNMGATLLDLGDGCLGLEFHTKMNSLDADIIGLYGEALDLLDASDDWRALVVGNEGAAFSAGANIMLVMMAAMQQEWGQIEALTKGLQDTVMRAKYSDKPVVTAPHGLTLGGGAEVAMHGAGTVATGELYMGLVEVGVGLLPAGGGCKEVVWRLVGSVPEGVDIDVNPFVQKAFLQIGMGKVAESADEARGFGYVRPHDLISLSKDHQIADAKALALGLVNAGYVAPKRRALKLPGRNGIAALNTAIWSMVQAQQISEHDAKIGRHIAKILCGGDVAAGTARTEQDLLDLEREGFLSLCGEQKTIERIQHMLMKGKPLRN